MNESQDRLGRYELRGVLGGGSFATVYRARDPLLGREVALKALLPHLAASDEDRRRFLAEGKALAALRHPNIVTVYDVGEADGRPFLAMELLTGRTLAQILPEDGLPIDRVAALVRQLAAALDCLHRAGYVHRDLKDTNVMLDGDGRVVLMDFGIALPPSGTRLTETGYGMGTPETAAPEQISGGKVGPAADIYALGALTYELLAGQPPFTGHPAHVLYAHVHMPPPPLRDLRPGLPKSVYAAVDAALAKDPGKRPHSAGKFAELLASGLKADAGAADEAAAQLPGEPPRRYEGGGDGSFTLYLRPGFTTFRSSHAAARPGTFTVSIQPKDAEDAGDSGPLQLVTVIGDYEGITGREIAPGGGYLCLIRATGAWSVEITQPWLEDQQARPSAIGHGDGVAYLRITSGTRSLRITHRTTRAGPFHVSLLWPAGEGRSPDLLAAGPGPYQGIASRRFPRTGTYVVVVQATGDWSLAVL
ncbi:MAG: serine/threonine-protein kinase [Dehalococcoidia bacterium]